MTQYVPIAGLVVCIIIVFMSMSMKRLIGLAPPIALLFAAISNYTIPLLSSAGIGEMLIRVIVSYVVIRSAAEMSKRVTAGNPARMQYAAQQPTFEFEDV